MAVSNPKDENRLRVRTNRATAEGIAFVNSLGMTTTEAIREAVELYVFALRNRKGGRKLVSMNPDGSDVVEIM